MEGNAPNSESEFGFRDLSKNGRLDPYEDPRRPIEDLLSQMTMEEKAGMLFQQAIALNPDGTLVEGEAFGRPMSTTHMVLTQSMNHFNVLRGTRPGLMAPWYNRLQALGERTRLGIPIFVHEESVGGFCHRDATVFPQGIGLAATWNPALVEQVAGVIREQMLAVGARLALAPVLDVARDPRWGRVEETYGEDPHLSGTIGTAYVRGLQTSDLRGGGGQKLYVQDQVASVARPDRILIGFARVLLDPGQARSVRFTVHPSRLAFYDPQMRFVTEPGAFTSA